MKEYESVVIFRPDLSPEEIKKEKASVVSMIKKEKGSIIHEEDWGKKLLAYPIQKLDYGYYYIVHYKAPAYFIKQVEIIYKRNEKILRFLNVFLDKYGSDYLVKRREYHKNILS